MCTDYNQLLSAMRNNHFCPSPLRDSRSWGASRAVRGAAKKQTCCFCYHELSMESNHAPKLTCFFTTLLWKLKIQLAMDFVPSSVAGEISTLPSPDVTNPVQKNKYCLVTFVVHQFCCCTNQYFHMNSGSNVKNPTLFFWVLFLLIWAYTT